ncbi:MAG TPA: AraC family transcriptional regulator [Clostridia bacterium]|nr:AraC family transcriptional regulator [Clostridia bacterium]
MDYYLFIWSIATFIEERLKEGIKHDELEEAVGFSYRHIREVFRKCTKVTLAHYILSRKVINAAFQIVHTQRSLTSIAADYGFESYDTFTRAFVRVTGATPSEFRKEHIPVGRRLLVAGTFAPAILKDGNETGRPGFTGVEIDMKQVGRTEKSCILFGVPKVEYTYEEMTPFPACLRSILNYMGQQIDYSYLMAASGAAFRLRWNLNCWDGGNVDIQNIYENRLEPFERSFKAAGRNYSILLRSNTDKEGFTKFIKSEIDSGRPVIALGIIGPPEACIITGYDDDGDTLLGWNLFQDNPEFAKDVKLHETGYFICSSWWENNCTCMVMSVGEETIPSTSRKDIVLNAIDIMSRKSVSFRNEYTSESQIYTGGQAAYDAWAKAVGNDGEFPENAILPILFERIMCQHDAQVMVGEGRSYAAVFMDRLGSDNPAAAKHCGEAAEYFRKAVQCMHKIDEAKGGYMQTEEVTRKFAQRDVRRQITALILEAKQYEAKACECMRKLADSL